MASLYFIESIKYSGFKLSNMTQFWMSPRDNFVYICTACGVRIADPKMASGLEICYTLLKIHYM